MLSTIIITTEVLKELDLKNYFFKCHVCVKLSANKFTPPSDKFLRSHTVQERKEEITAVRKTRERFFLSNGSQVLCM